MMADVVTVARKELTEMVLNPKSLRQNLMGLGVAVVLADFVMPIFIENYLFSIAIVMAIGAMMISIGPLTTAADSVAGERERHTLETLLSTRLPDSAIVIGKLVAIIGSSLALGAVFLLQGLVVVSLLYGRFDAIPLALGLGIPAVLFGAIIAGCFLGPLGIIISARAQTVQSAAQTLGLLILPLVMLPTAGGAVLVPIFGLERLEAFATFLAAGGAWVVGALVLGGVIVVDALLILWMTRRFTRFRVMER